MIASPPKATDLDTSPPVPPWWRAREHRASERALLHHLQSHARTTASRPPLSHAQKTIHSKTLPSQSHYRMHGKQQTKYGRWQCSDHLPRSRQCNTTLASVYAPLLKKSFPKACGKLTARRILLPQTCTDRCRWNNTKGGSFSKKLCWTASPLHIPSRGH